LEDILLNIERIEKFTARMNAATFASDAKTCDAVERCLERISEAAKKLGSTAESLCPDIPWQSIRGLGNFMRHEYDNIDISRIWRTVERDITPLKSAIQAAVKTLRNQKPQA
jgi:uncharacterized protein with HEPN domain